MAGSSLLALLDDIATLLDDVAVMSKVAAKKTAGVLGDDLALNAEQVSGVAANRELPVVWAVAKGSMWNKVILVPAALAISALIPWAIVPLLMIGGLFLCYEGVEKLAHRWLHSKDDDERHRAELLEAAARSKADVLAFEKNKIKGAIRTDFILSAEIIVITLGTVAAASFGKQVAVLSTIAIGITVIVYGLVAGIVKLDDLGLYLNRLEGAGKAAQRQIGAWILIAAPYLMKTLSVVGTAAMFMVGGAIIVHGIPALHHLVQQAGEHVSTMGFGWFISAFSVVLLESLIGILAGIATLLLITGGKRLFGNKTAHA
jgi:predicted DNA repair protein MutK